MYSDIGTQCVALHVNNNNNNNNINNNNNNVTYFDSFGVEQIPKEIKAFINHTFSSASHDKNITTNIFRIQAYDSIMCGYFCIGFIDYMLAGKTLTEYTNLFSPNNF